MVILHGKDRATGNYSVTASKLKKCSSSFTSEDFTDSTYDIDPIMSQFSVQDTPHSVDDDVDMMPHSLSEHVSLSPHGIGGGNKRSRKSLIKRKRLLSNG